MRIPVTGWRKDKSKDGAPEARDDAQAQGDAERAPEGFASSEGDGAPGENDALETLRAERDSLEEKYKRTLADYHNSQRRATQNERDARQRGVEAVVESVITALDHFEKALAQDASTMSAEQLVGGVRLIQGELIKAVQRHGGGLIEPKPNDEFDPMRHQAVARSAAEGVEPGRIVRVLQTGYTLGERTIRPAMVVVAPGEGEG